MLNDNVTTIFGLIGGLAVFIYGMNFMSDGLQKMAGNKLKRIIEILTNNPLIGVIVGTLITALMQSSSATTVLVVGFVSAKLMTLPQAISVIMGANVGTTITSQLIAFKISNYAYPIAFIGFVLYFFIKKKKIKHIGQTIFAFGLLFIGLKIMGDAMKPLAKSEFFEQLVLQLNNSRIFGFLLGTVMTVVVQSSSATIGVLQELASSAQEIETASAITVTTAMPILFGCNVGTTVTAILASIGAKINSKRAALAHTIFNVLGAVIFMFLIPVFSKLVLSISPANNISRQIANSHTLFNLVNTFVWLPFIPFLSKVAKTVIKGEETGIEKRTLYLDYKILGSPVLSMDLATKELSRMAQFAKEMVTYAKHAVVEDDMKYVEHINEYEDTVDMLQYEITKYLSTMLSEGVLTSEQSIQLSGLMHVTNDIERMGDHCKNIGNFSSLKHDEKFEFSEIATKELKNAFEKVEQIVNDAIAALQSNDIESANKVLKEETEVDNLEASLRDSHFKRLDEGICNPLATTTYVELVHNLERIADHCDNIAEIVLKGTSKKLES